MKKSSAVMAALLLTLGATGAAAETFVVSSSGPSARSYPSGRALPDDAHVTLRANDVVVVAVGGETRTLRGPGTFTPAVASGVRTQSPVVAAGGDQTRRRIGAVRQPRRPQQTSEATPPTQERQP